MSHFSIIDPNTKDDIQQCVLSTFENLFSNIFLFFSLNTFFHNALELYFFNVTLEYVFFNGPCFSYFFHPFLSFIHPKGKPFLTQWCIYPSDSERIPRMTFLWLTSPCSGSEYLSFVVAIIIICFWHLSKANDANTDWNGFLFRLDRRRLFIWIVHSDRPTITH